MKKLVRFAVMGLLALSMATLALAQEVTNTVVQVPIGTWADYILPIAGALAMAAVIYGLSFLPAPVAAFIKTILTEQLLKKAVDFGIAMVRGATKDKVLEVDVGNAVVKTAADYVIKYGPKWVYDWLGGEAGIKDHIIARLDVKEDAGLEPHAVIAGATVPAGVIPGPAKP